jgi:RNA polymerase primary sigma factor
MKNTAKTLTLTAKKASTTSTAQLSVPKTATSYFLETEAAEGGPAAKVTVVKTRSRLASLKAVQPEPAEAEAAPAEQHEEAVPAPVAAVMPDGDDGLPTPVVTAAAAPVIVRKRTSKLAALKAQANEASEAQVAAPAGQDTPEASRSWPRKRPRRPAASSAVAPRAASSRARPRTVARTVARTASRRPSATSALPPTRPRWPPSIPRATCCRA